MTSHDQPQEPNAIPPPVALLQLVTGYWVSQAIYVAAKLGLADLLRDGPKSCSELAQATATHARSLARLLRALASVGVFAEVEGDRFGLTPLAATLQTEGPGSLRALAIFFGAPEHWRPWGNLLHSVQTGQTAFDQTFGLRPYEYLAQHPAAAEIFHGSMTEFTTRATRAITAAYDFSQFGQLVDVGGGTHFALRVHGDSMIEAGIADGDVVIVRQQDTAEPGDIVVALLGDEATVKRLRKKG